MLNLFIIRKIRYAAACRIVVWLIGFAGVDEGCEILSAAL